MNEAKPCLACASAFAPDFPSRRVCAACRSAREERDSRRRRERLRLLPDESPAALDRVAIRTRGEVAAMLGVSRNAVYQAERSALFRIRRNSAEVEAWLDFAAECERQKLFAEAAQIRREVGELRQRTKR